MFERQLAWLQRHGYRSLRLGDLHRTWYGDGVREIAGRPVAITFDDAFADFHDKRGRCCANTASMQPSSSPSTMWAGRRRGTAMPERPR
jgi:hypothetical protein